MSAPQGFSDERHGDVVLVRPMRDHTLKEVAFYNHLFGVPSVFTPAIDTKVGLWRSAWARWGQPLHTGSEIPGALLDLESLPASVSPSPSWFSATLAPAVLPLKVSSSVHVSKGLQACPVPWKNRLEGEG